MVARLFALHSIAVGGACGGTPNGSCPGKENCILHLSLSAVSPSFWSPFPWSSPTDWRRRRDAATSALTAFFLMEILVELI